MSTTVLEALRCAQINFETLGDSGASMHPCFIIGKSQLDNAIKALENGRAPDHVIQEGGMLSDVNTD